MLACGAASTKLKCRSRVRISSAAMSGCAIAKRGSTFTCCTTTSLMEALHLLEALSVTLAPPPRRRPAADASGGVHGGLTPGASGSDTGATRLDPCRLCADAPAGGFAPGAHRGGPRSRDRFHRGWSTRNCTTRNCRQARQGKACFGLEMDRGGFRCFQSIRGQRRLPFWSHDATVSQEVE